jgi:glycosyltransferase involved in cell wall biosynthesis
VVLMDAMANELPVVTSRLAGIAELVDHEVSGLLLPPARDDVIVDALERLAGDPELRARWGRAGRDRVLRDFEVGESAARLEALFASRGAGAVSWPGNRCAGTGAQGPQQQETADASA